MSWFAVRSIYLFGRKSDGMNIFEERIVSFEAGTGDDLFAKSEREADAYVAAQNASAGTARNPIKITRHPVQDACEQDGEELIDGYEIWSRLYRRRTTARPTSSSPAKGTPSTTARRATTASTPTTPPAAATT